MKRTVARRSAPFLVFVLALALPATQLLAEDKKDVKKDDRAPQAKAGDKTVYTTEDLKRDIAAQGDAAGSGAVYNNRYLNERFTAPETPEAAFTNQDLRERFGNETPGAAPVAPAPAAEAASPEPEAPPTPGTPPQAATRPLTDEERARRIDALGQELAQLEQRILAIKNPLLAGTAPPLEGEKPGMDAVERLRVTEAKVDELKKALEELKK